MMDANSKLEYSAELSVVRFLSRHKIPTRVVCQGSYTQKTGRQIMKCFSICNDKYYIYFQGRYINNPTKPGKISVFSSVVLIDWSTGHPKELEHQHIDTIEDINHFLGALLNYIDKEEDND